MILRRLGQQADQCEGGYYCPQVLEMENGDFAVVGPLITEAVAKAMPPGPGIGPNEAGVSIPRSIMLEAIREALKAA